jgi:hypothetical protein
VHLCIRGVLFKTVDLVDVGQLGEQKSNVKTD